MLNKILKSLGYEKVVHCKDCSLGEAKEPGMVWCPFVIGSWVNNDFHCGAGVKEVQGKQCR